MGVDVGVEDGSRIEVTFEEVNNENINVELIDNPVTIELDTPGNVQVSFNEQYSDVNVILDHNKQINRNLNKQHTAETIQESTSKRFTSDLEMGSKADSTTVTTHINNTNNPHSTSITNLFGYPTTPTNNKFLRDDKTFAEIVAGSGGYDANVYFTSLNSDIATYKKISYSLEPSETIISVSATNESKLINTYLYDSGVGVTNLDEGSWDYYINCKLDVISGSNRLKAILFKRSSLGVESDLFTSYSSELINNDYLQIRFQNIQSNIPVLTTDRIGIRVYFETTNTNPTTISLKVGDGNASYFTTPLALRHSQLRLPNEDSNVQHLTNAEKNKGALATGVVALPTVKKVADITNKYVGSEDTFTDYNIETTLTNFSDWGVIPYKGDGRYINIVFMPKATAIEYAVVEWNEVLDSVGVSVVQYSDIYYKTCIIGVADSIVDFLLPNGKYLAIRGCGYSGKTSHKPYQYFNSLSAPFYSKQYGLAIDFTYINKGVIFDELSDLLNLESRVTDIKLSDKSYNLIVNSFDLPYTATYNVLTGLVDIVPNPYTGSGDNYLTYNDRRVNDLVHVQQKANGWMLFAANDQYVYIINQNGTQVASIELATGGVGGFMSVSGYNISTLLDKDFYILNTPASVDIYLSNKVLWVSVSKESIRYATPSFGAVTHQSVAGSHWYCNILGAFSVSSNSSSRLNYDSLQSVDTEAEVLVTSKFLPNGIAKMPLSSSTIGKTIQLYGDSVSSVDYPWYKAYLQKYTGSIVYSDGFSGYSTRALSSNYCYQKVVDRLPNFILYLVGGNDTGASGTVGTFDASSPNGVLGESVVVESNIALDFCTDGLHTNNNNYQSLYFIVAISHFIRKWKAQYYNFRANVVLTGSETEAEKKAKLDAVYKPKLILCTTLPQQRNNSSDAFSIPLNWQRKINAVKECAKKYNVDIIDFSELYQLDMSVEPYWVSPTSTTNNKGTYTMDGLHPNEYGYDRLARLISDYIKRF